VQIHEEEAERNKEQYKNTHPGPAFNTLERCRKNAEIFQVAKENKWVS